MKDQPWDLNQSWPVGQKWCWFINTTRKFLGPSPKIWGAKNIIFGPLFSATSALDTAYLWNETKHGQTKMVESIYNVSSTRWPTFRDLWPRSGWCNIRRPLRCNHQSCDISSCFTNILSYDENHTVARWCLHCCKGDQLFLWKRAELGYQNSESPE